MMLCIFGLLYVLGLSVSVDTLLAELIVLAMAVLLALGYLPLIPASDKEPTLPLIVLFLLNLLCTALIWATGLLYSPFIILYVIIIIITTQIYRYTAGILQTLTAIVGFIFIYGATIERILPFYTLLPNSEVGVLYQPSTVIIIYGLLYSMLMLFTVFSSSSARMMLYRPIKKVDMDVTYQEKIIQDMPLGVMIVDSDLSILGANPAATIQFPFSGPPADLTKYLSLTKLDPKHALHSLTKSGAVKKLTWKMDTGEIVPLAISARELPGEKHKDASFILFLQPL